MNNMVKKHFWKITSNGPPNQSRFKPQKLTKLKNIPSVRTLSLSQNGYDTNLMRNRGWLGPWLCKDECGAEALLINTHENYKWSWKEYETTTNSTKNSVLDFLMLITCDPPLWSTLNWYVQSLPDLALEVSLKYQGCSTTLNTPRIKGYSVAFDEVASNFEEENRKSISEIPLYWLITWQHTWTSYYMGEAMYL